MPKIELKKVILASLLTALAVGINLFFQYLIPSSDSGLPLYSIPLIIASLYLGPWYGVLIGIAADTAIGFLGPYGYMPLFILSTLAWSVIPGIIARKRYSLFKMVAAISISYLFATLGNTLALAVNISSNVAISSLTVRIPVMLVSLTPLIYVTHLIYSRLLAYIKPDAMIEEDNYYPYYKRLYKKQSKRKWSN